MAAAASKIVTLALACAACTTIAADARSFEGTHWRVEAIDGRPTPANGDYHIAFKRGEITGRFGCNGWGGQYSASGGTLEARRIISTQMACGDPAGSFEREGLTILQHPVRLTWSGKQRLLLANASGSISLRRLP